MRTNCNIRFYGLLLTVASITGRIACQDLKSDLTGAGLTALFPGDSGYQDASKAYNLRFNVSPAAVVYPESAQQVAAAIQAGASTHTQVVARSGGHSYIANGVGGKNGALVIDLSKLKNITVDNNAGTAVIQTGNRLGDVAQALNDQGRALPHGTCPYVGVGGHASFGGFGFASRMWGLTIDHIISAEVVLANGTIVTASNTTNSDLFWAMRGAGSSFGITTAFTFATEPVPSSALVFSYSWNAVNATALAHIISAYQSFVQTDIPATFDAELTLGKGGSSNTASVEFVGGWYGKPADLNSTVKPFLDQIPQKPTVSITGGTWLESLESLAGSDTLSTSAPDETDTFYAKSLMTPENSPMSAAAINAFASYLTHQGYTSNTNWFTQIELYGGPNSAINAVPLDATSFASRSTLFTIQFYASSSNYSPPYPNVGFSFLDAMVASIVDNSPSDWAYGAYTNYIEDKLNNSQALYYGSHYERLQSIKKEVDPNNVFNFLTSIAEPQ